MSMDEECGLGRASFFTVAVGVTTGEEVSSLVAFPNNLEDRAAPYDDGQNVVCVPEGGKFHFENTSLKKIVRYQPIDTHAPKRVV